MKNAISDKRYAISKIGIIFVLALFCLILPQAAQAADYYVDAVNGDDANPGTSAQPWKTLNRAYTWYSGTGPKVQEGDTVYFRDGDYGNFLDTSRIPADNEPFYRTDWITYKADAGHTPTLTHVDIYNADLWGTTRIDGSSYLILDGFNILNGVKIERTSYVQVRNCNITRSTFPYQGVYAPYVPSHASGAILYSSHYVTFENNEIYLVWRGLEGEGGSTNVIIKDNTIHQLGEDGFSMPLSHLLVEGNLIYDSNESRSPASFTGTKTGTFIVGETIIQQGTGAQGIVTIEDPSGTPNLEAIQTNYLNFLKQSAGGGTITGQQSGATLSDIIDVDFSHTDGFSIDSSAGLTDIIIRGNIVIRESTQGQQGCKINCRAGGQPITGLVIENNLIVAGKPIIGQALSGIYIDSMCNNTFYDNVGGSGVVVSPTAVTNMYNNVFACSQGLTGVMSHGNNIFRYNPTSFSINPTELVYYDVSSLFVDAANGDFRLASNSAAIDFGDPLHAPATDILGNPRDALPDAGCYEYGASTLLYGDVSGDSDISAYDAALTAQAAVDLITLTPEQFNAADVDGSKDISAYDAALIAQYSVGLISKFPVEG